MSQPPTSPPPGGTREGNLDAPTRHALEWKQPAFWDRDALEQEMARMFDLCHGCRRCARR